MTWMFVLPLSFLYILWDGNSRNLLENIFFRQSWGFFYNEYTRKAYYWEFIKIF